MAEPAQTLSGQKWDAVVIGSGMGGMTAAAYLAAAGKKTLLLEQYEVLGGCTHVFRRKKKWEFEVGVHYLGDCHGEGHIPTMFRGLGLEERIEFLPLDDEAFDTIVFPGLRLQVPKGWEQYQANVLELFPEEKTAINKYFRIMRAVAESIDRGSTPSSWLSAGRLIKDAGLAGVWAAAPLDALLKYCGLSERAQAVLSTQYGAYCSPPHRTPVSLHAGFLGNYVGNGAWYPKGGGQMLAATLAEAVRAYGGEIRLSTPVSKINVDHGRVTGVTLENGEQINSSVVVSAADIKHTFLDMIDREQLPALVAKRVESYRMCTPFFNAYLGVDMDLRDSANTNYYSNPTWETPSHLFRRFAKAAEARSRQEFIDQAWAQMPAYVHSSTTKDPAGHYAPPGQSSLEVMTLVPHAPKLWDASGKEYWKSDEYLRLKEELTNVMIDRLNIIFPGADQKILYREAGTPHTQERYTWTSEGSAYGIEPNYLQFGPLRPDSKTALSGLFLAGASTRWGPSIEGAMLSGLHAASVILDRDLSTEIHGGRVLGDKSRLPVRPASWDPLKASMKPVQRRNSPAMESELDANEPAE